MTTTTPETTPPRTQEAGPQPPPAAPSDFQRLLQREHLIRSGAFEDPALFVHAQRVAKILNTSMMVPDRYRGEANIGNAVIAVDISFRLGLPVLMVMQNLYVVYGTPSWSGQMVLGLINASGLFREPLDFEFKGEKGKDEWGCRCVATTKLGTRCEGPWVDIAIAKAEGWWDRKDKEGRPCSKWRTIPDMMVRYRAAAYFGRTKCPEVLLGLTTREEMEDIGPANFPAELTENVSAPKTKPDLSGKKPPATGDGSLGPQQQAATAPLPVTTTTEPRKSVKERKPADDDLPMESTPVTESADGPTAAQVAEALSPQFKLAATLSTVPFNRFFPWAVRLARVSQEDIAAEPKGYEDLSTETCVALLADEASLRKVALLYGTKPA